LQNLHQLFVLCTASQIIGGDFANFVAFSEYMNFDFYLLAREKFEVTPLLDVCTEVRFASLLSGGITNMAVINPPKRKLTKRTSVVWVNCAKIDFVQ